MTDERVREAKAGQRPDADLMPLIFPGNMQSNLTQNPPPRRIWRNHLHYYAGDQPWLKY